MIKHTSSSRVPGDRAPSNEIIVIIAGRFDEIRVRATLVDGERGAVDAVGVSLGKIVVSDIEEGEHFLGYWVTTFGIEVRDFREQSLRGDCKCLSKWGGDKGGEHCAQDFTREQGLI